ILYAFSSMGNNNGSAFAGLNANTPFYNLLGGVAMLIARYWLAIPTLAIAGSLAQKKLVPAGPGTLPTPTPLFVALLIGIVLTAGLFVQALVGQGEAPAGFIVAVSLWLWFTVLFANFAEAMAEGRGAAQADELRRQRREITAKRLDRPPGNGGFNPTTARTTTARSSELHKGDVILVEAGDFIPSDGEVIEGVASVDESAITGESAPVIRESGGDRSAVTGGT